VSVETAQKWESAFTKKQQKLVPTSTNLVDQVWKNQPPAETNPVIVHLLEFAGRSVADKLKDLREKFKQEKARGMIITTLDEVSLSLTNYSPFTACFLLRFETHFLMNILRLVWFEF